MTAATIEKNTTGSAVNPDAVKAAGPKLKDETQEQADRLKPGMKLDTNTNTLPTEQSYIDKELEALGTSREALTKLNAGLHQLSASHTLASGQITQEHWSTQKQEERAPVVAPVSFWEGQSITSTHVPNSVERVVGKDATVVVPHQVNMSVHSTIGRNTGQMSAVRASLRNAAADRFK